MDQRDLGAAATSSQVGGDEMSAAKKGLTGASELPTDSKENLPGRLEFDMFLADLSAQFISLPSNLIDGEIKAAERRICEFLDLDQIALWQWGEENPGELKLTHLFNGQGALPPPERMNGDHFPWYREQMLLGRMVAISSLGDLPAEAKRDRESALRFGIKSNLCLPLSVGANPIVGVLGFSTVRAERKWPDTLVKRLQLIAQIFGSALARKKADQERQRIDAQLSVRLKEIEELKRQLQDENLYLQKEIGLLAEKSDIVGKSDAIRNVLAQAEQVAGADSTVLLQGETGTGKELLAKAIHRMSARKDRLLVTVNCASLPATLLESELFGRERGAYTGALTRMAGRFEIADGSTLFLDEIGELPLDVQSKLLRVLEEGQFERLGSTKTLKSDVRIIAATNRDLEQAVKAGMFRQDLYYRLNVFPIEIPPLRERVDDIPLLVWGFVREFEKKIGRRIDRITRKTMESLQRYPWPGNIRELRNVIEYGMIVSIGNTLSVFLPQVESSARAATSDLESIERIHVLKVLTECAWRIGGKDGAAEVLGLKRTTLQSLMKRLAIKRPGPATPK